ncbi:hypothetical protein HDV57DRAFT_271542 [Trichoderma longibrachiatum]
MVKASPAQDPGPSTLSPRPACTCKSQTQSQSPSSQLSALRHQRDSKSRFEIDFSLLSTRPPGSIKLFLPIFLRLCFFYTLDQLLSRAFFTLYPFEDDSQPDILQTYSKLFSLPPEILTPPPVQFFQSTPPWAPSSASPPTPSPRRGSTPSASGGYAGPSCGRCSCSRVRASSSSSATRRCSGSAASASRCQPSFCCTSSGSRCSSAMSSGRCTPETRSTGSWARTCRWASASFTARTRGSCILRSGRRSTLRARLNRWPRRAARTTKAFSADSADLITRPRLSCWWALECCSSCS